MAKIYTKAKKKHKKVLQKIINGTHPATAYQEVYKCAPNTAASQVSQLLSSVEYKKDISNALDAQGLSISHANKKLQYIIDSPTKPIIIGKEIQQVEDKRLLLDAVKEIHRLHKLGEPATINISDNRSINFHAAPETTRALQDIAQTIAALSSELEESKIDGEITQVYDVSANMADITQAG